VEVHLAINPKLGQCVLAITERKKRHTLNRGFADRPPNQLSGNAYNQID
jgi:hypothetical protein